MDLIPAPKSSSPNADQTQSASGIALFMVITAISILSIIVTEFAYVAQINQRMAFDALDQVKAHYLAKSGFKLSLLRLKAYQQIKALAGGSTPGIAQAIPKQVLDKIWSFPFYFPIPTNLPGMSMADKDRIEKFQKASGLEGKFSAIISSESSKFNINQILEPFAQVRPLATGTPTPGPSGTPPPPAPPASPNPSASTPAFDPQEARKHLYDYMANIFSAKLEADDEFASEYRDYRLNDLVDGIVAWADRTYENPAVRPRDEAPPLKRAPFYTLTELHMVPGMNDELYELFAPNLTVTPTQGININGVSEETLRGLVPQMTKTEIEEFFKKRNNDEDGTFFKNGDDFFKYLLDNVAAFHHDQGEVDRFRADLNKRNIHFITEETDFKITVQAQVNQSSRFIEAWVSFSNGGSSGPNPHPSGSPTPQPSGQPGPAINLGQTPPPDSGLRITYMRIL